jgi:hypothetical protein
MCTVHEDQYTVLIISRTVLLRMRNIPDRSCRENQNTLLCSITFFNYAIYKIIWKNVVERGRPLMTIRRMRTACLILKTTITHSSYVILTVFPPQQRLHECASTFRYIYFASLVNVRLLQGKNRMG